MARSIKARGAAATALAIASGSALVLAAAAPAGATATHAPAYYAGSTSADVLGLTVNLPTALPSLPNPLQVGLIHVDGSTVHDPLHLAGKTSASAEATASLATGSLVDALQHTLGVDLDRVAHVQLGSGKLSDSSSLLDIPAKPVADVSVGSLAASLNRFTDASTSSANEVDATLGSADDLLGTATVNNVTNSLNSVASQVQSTVQQVLGQLNSITGNNSTVATVTNTVDAVLAKVQTLVANLGTTPLVDVDVHDTSQTVTPARDGVLSTSKLGLVGVNLLGGLLKVTGFSSGATAFANGKPGGAQVSSFADKPIVTVDAADALCAQLDTSGISLCSATGLPASIQTQVNSLLKELSGELTTLESTLLKGVITVSELPGTSHTAANGRSASVTAPSYAVDLAHVVRLDLGSGVSASAAAASPAAVAAPAVQAAPEPVALPHTGVNLGLIGGAALLLLVGAAVLRRRLMG